MAQTFISKIFKRAKTTVRFGTFVAITMAVASLTACFDRAHIDLAGLNYTDIPIAEFSVDGYGGGGIFENGGGGQFVCCVAVPRRWKEGMSVTVRWTEDGPANTERKTAAVAVPKYDENDLGFFAVHFYPGDVVRVLVTTKTARHPDYPYPRPAR